MKKRCFLLFIILLTFIHINVFASPKTYDRTNDNLRIPKDVKLENNPIDVIMRIPSVDSSQKIYDFSDLFTEDEEKNIQKELNSFIKKTGIDSLVVTSNDLSGFSMAEYVYKFYDYNDFLQDGILFLIYTHDDKVEIFMGNSGNNNSKVFKVYNESRINQILKYVYEKQIVNKNYYEAINSYIIITQGLYEKEYGNYIVSEDGKVLADIPWVEIFILSFALTFIIVVLIVTKFTTKVKRRNDMIKKSVNDVSMVVKCEYDRLLDSKDKS